MRRVLITSAVLAAFVALPSIAAAQAPPPESGIGEYQENIPGAGGDQPSNGGQGGGGGGQGGSGGGGQGGSGGSGGTGGAGETTPGGTGGDPGISPQVIDEFEQRGADGAAAANVAQSSSPTGSKPGGAGAGKAGRSDSSSQSGGMGVALPIILGSSLAAALLFVFARRRGLGPFDA